MKCPLRLCQGCVRMLMGIPVGLCFTTALVGVVRWAAHYPDGRVLFQRGARSGPSCGVWAGVRLDEPTTGERLRNLQESDVSLQQRLQVSRAAHGLVVPNLRNHEYRHWCDHPAILRQCCTLPGCMLFNATFRSSNRFGCQSVMTAGFQYWPVLMMALSIVRNFHIHSVRASFFGLPAASNR